MAVWLVRTTWMEDETEATEQWEAEAETAADAVKDVTAHLRFPPHDVEARLCEPDPGTTRVALRPGEVRRIEPR